MEPLAGISCPYAGDEEANTYMKSHSTGCLYNPAAVKETMHRREQQAGERTRRWAAEDEARAQRWAAEDKAEAQSWADGAEALRIAAENEAQAENYDTCTCPWIDWCTCGAASIAEERMQMNAQSLTAFDMISVSMSESGEIQENYRNLCTKINMDSSTLEKTWQTYRTNAQTLEEITKHQTQEGHQLGEDP